MAVFGTAPIWRAAPLISAAAVLASAGLMATAAALARDERQRGTSVLFGLVGLAWAVGWLDNWHAGPFPLLAYVIGPCCVLLGALAVRRGLAVVLAVWLLAARCGMALTSDSSRFGYGPDAWWPTLRSDDALYQRFSAAFWTCAAVLATVGLVLVARRVGRTPRLDRWMLAPLTACLGIVGVIAAAWIPWRLFTAGATTPPVLVAAQSVGLLLVPVGAFASAARRLLARLAVVDLTMLQLAAAREEIRRQLMTERRRIERDLHDGVQQRLVALTLRLAAAEQSLDPAGRSLVAQARLEVHTSLRELRDLVHGIYPAALSGGLRPALSDLAEALPLPVVLDVPDLRWAPGVEATAFFVVAEALTNTMKHAGATTARVRVRVAGRRLRVEVADDGNGRVDPAAGAGLAGLKERLIAVGGDLTVGGGDDGARLVADIPLC
ncbi:sensor histidine kinase [Asanoa ishikariensis]|uniref:sensor histidine kinase n=1 Tax=Asanoa ishikariensis TaxID=137265 RepID=UPI00115FA105|nr:histidine kinase [Asanoa ishikariensis]